MIYSMTGYGRAEKEFDGKKVIVELNSLNNRYCEIQIRLPRTFSQYEHDLKDIIATRVKRGKVLVNIALEEDQAIAVERLELNQDSARMYHRIYSELKDKLNLSGEITLQHFMALPDLIKPAEEEMEESEIVNSITECLKQALDAFLKMRQDEGRKLLDDIIVHLDKIEQSLLKTEKIADNNIDAYYQKLEARIKELIGNLSVAQEILATEAAVVAERADITEECVRIKSHLEMFRQSFETDGSVGKKMNFILQELYREANTIGSKSISADISGHVIDMKEEIEKVREQVQNIE